MRIAPTVLACALAAALPAVISAKEKAVKKSDVPAPVIAAFEKAYPKATAKTYARDDDNGKVCYEIESVEGSTPRDILFSADGAVLEAEEGLRPNEVPDVVVHAVMARYPMGVIERAEKLTKSETTTFELVVRLGKSRVEVKADPNGTIAPDTKQQPEAGPGSSVTYRVGRGWLASGRAVR